MRTLALTGLLVFVSACASAPPAAALISPLPYQEAFQKIRSYLQDCLPASRLRANLYTEFPEAELVVDEMPRRIILAAGDFESAHEVVNIHIFGEDGSSRIESKTPLSRSIAESALASRPCPK